MKVRGILQMVCYLSDKVTANDFHWYSEVIQRTVLRFSKTQIIKTTTLRKKYNSNTVSTVYAEAFEVNEDCSKFKVIQGHVSSQVIGLSQWQTERQRIAVMLLNDQKDSCSRFL